MSRAQPMKLAPADHLKQNARHKAPIRDAIENENHQQPSRVEIRDQHLHTWQPVVHTTLQLSLVKSPATEPIAPGPLAPWRPSESLQAHARSLGLGSILLGSLFIPRNYQLQLIHLRHPTKRLQYHRSVATARVRHDLVYRVRESPKIAPRSRFCR